MCDAWGPIIFWIQIAGKFFLFPCKYVSSETKSYIRFFKCKTFFSATGFEINIHMAKQVL